MKILNKSGPRIDLWGIPQIVFHDLLNTEPIFVLRFLPLRYSTITFKLFLCKPYASNLAKLQTSGAYIGMHCVMVLGQYT